MKKFIFIFSLLFLLSILISLIGIVNSEGTNTELSTYTSVDQAITLNNDLTFEGVSKDSSVTTNSEGSVITADLTATKDTTWNIDGKDIDVSTGTHLTYKDGITTIEPSDPNALSKSTIETKETTAEIKSNLEVTYEEDVFYGNDFSVDGFDISGRFDNEGGIEKLDINSYSLSSGSVLTTDYLELKTPTTNDIFFTDSEDIFSKNKGTSLYIDTYDFSTKTIEGESLSIDNLLIAAEVGDGSSLSYVNNNPSNNPTILDSLRSQQGIIDGREVGVSFQAIGDELNIGRNANGALTILPDDSDLPISLKNGLGASLNPFGGSVTVGQHVSGMITGQAEVGGTVEWMNSDGTLAIRGEILCNTGGEVRAQAGCAARF